jgi:predicted ATPase
VSIVFADLAGSTGLAERLDPETTHNLLDRFTQSCAGVIERHGGTVEGFIGDAVVGVFGLKELHEDDALRAVRAAVEMREAAEALSAELERERGVEISVKFGVEAGEVFLGAGSSRSPFAAGDAFNVAARLEGLSPPGEILLGENIHPLVEGAVRAEPLEPVTLKGRAAEVRPWRLVGLIDDPADVAPPRSPFVNRARETKELRAAFTRAQSEGACHAVTVAGPPGIGKSRLVRELAGQLDDADVLVGRCVSYGEGVTYRPLAEIVRQLGGEDPRPRLEELLEGEDAVVRLVLGAIGLSEEAAQTDEIFWAVRRLLERAASERPLVVVVDDVHWAEQTLLDLLEYLVAFSGAQPVLLVSIARPEFLETRPAWAAPLPNRSLLMLDSLSDTHARELVESAAGEVGSQTAAQIVDTAEGNPLFLEQLVAVGAERGQSALPSSIQAVLAARIDHLEPGERTLLEYASVQGRSFYVGAVAELLPDAGRSAIATDLVSLVRKQLIRADRPELPGEDAFRFGHALIREAAYQGLPRRRRAELHELMADWLGRHAGTRDETIGYHLGEAYHQLAELGQIGERERALATAAAQRLASAADAALLRGDFPAGASLLERAAALLEPSDPARTALLPRLGAALLDAGRLADADRILAEAIERGGDDPWLDARARVERQLVRLQSESGANTEDTEAIVDAALTQLEAHGDEIGQCRAMCLRALQAWVEGRANRADDAWCRAAEHARRAGDQAALFDILDWRASAALFGPTPVPAAIAVCQEIHAEVRTSPVAAALTCRPLAALHAMAGDLDEARRLVASADEILGEIGGLQAAITHQEALVERLAGDPAAAAARLRAGYDRLEEMGERALLASTAAWLAHALLAQGLTEEAERFCRVSEEAAPEGDLTAQLGWRGVRARLLAAEGRMEEAQGRALEAVRLAEQMEFPTLHADALRDLADVLHEAGRPEEAEAAEQAALDLYRRKGDVVSPTIGGSRDQVHDGKHQ